jgi:hypothetical protein
MRCRRAEESRSVVCKGRRATAQKLESTRFALIVGFVGSIPRMPELALSTNRTGLAALDFNVIA